MEHVLNEHNFSMKPSDDPRLTEPINLFDPQELHKQRILHIQQEIENKYTPIQPVREPVLFRPVPIDSAKKMLGRIESEKRELRSKTDYKNREQPSAIDQRRTDRAIERLLAAASPELRKNETEMLTIITERPEALRLVDESLLTKDFLLKALEANPRAYDIFPPQAQQDESIVLAYIASLKNHALPLGVAYVKDTRVIAAALDINPACPLEKMAIPLYRQQVEEAIQGKQIPHASQTPTSIFTIFRYNQDITIGPTATMIALLQDKFPHLQEQFKAVELDVLTQSKEIIMKNADTRKWHTHANVMHSLFEKHNLQDMAKDYEQAAWHNKCQKVTTHNPSRTEIKYLIESCPRDIVEQYVNIQTQEALPHTPGSQKAREEAHTLQKQLQTDPFSISSYSVWEAIDRYPATMKQIFDVEQFVKVLAQKAEMTQEGDLFRPVSQSVQADTEDRFYRNALEDAQRKCKWERESLERQHPEYLQTYLAEIQRLQEERRAWPPAVQDMKQLQQAIYRMPHGNHDIDCAVIRCLEKHPPEVYSKHVDISDYLATRAHWLRFTDSRNKEQQDQLKALISTSPVAKQIVLDHLKAEGEQFPEKVIATPRTLFPFSQEEKLHMQSRIEHADTTRNQKAQQLDDRTL